MRTMTILGPDESTGHGKLEQKLQGSRRGGHDVFVSGGYAYDKEIRSPFSVQNTPPVIEWA